MVRMLKKMRKGNGTLGLRQSVWGRKKMNIFREEREQEEGKNT